MEKLEKVSDLLKKVASGEDLEQNEKEWIKDNIVEDILGVYAHLGMDYNYDELTAKWANMPCDREAYEDLLELALNYYEELEDDYYSSRN